MTPRMGHWTGAVDWLNATARDQHLPGDHLVASGPIAAIVLSLKGLCPWTAHAATNSSRGRGAIIVPDHGPPRWLTGSTTMGRSQIGHFAFGFGGGTGLRLHSHAQARLRRPEPIGSIMPSAASCAGRAVSARVGRYGSATVVPRLRPATTSSASARTRCRGARHQHVNSSCFAASRAQWVAFPLIETSALTIASP